MTIFHSYVSHYQRVFLSMTQRPGLLQFVHPPEGREAIDLQLGHGARLLLRQALDPPATTPGYHFTSQLLLFGETTISDQPGFINPGLTLCVCVYIYIYMYILALIYWISALHLEVNYTETSDTNTCRK